MPVSFLALAACLSLAACQSSDLGKPCSGTPIDACANPIDGETPVIEVVGVQRDEACQSFQCLSQKGFGPYCTQSCGTAQDCPDGFTCQQVQNVGPLANQKFCVFQTGCTHNSDCHNLGNVQCVNLGCVDECLCGSCDSSASSCPSGTSPIHVLKCYGLKTLGCTCPTLTSCTDAELTCKPDGVTLLPTSAVAQVNACVPNAYVDNASGNDATGAAPTCTP